MTGIAFIGCGYVADLYMQTLPAHPELRLVAVHDRDPERLAAFSTFHGVPARARLEQVLDDPAVEIVINLTNPASHHAVSAAALDAGKAVYSEKPLATSLADAQDLVRRAEAAGVGVAAAPCSHLGTAVSAMAEAIAAGRIGRPLLAHAEMDDGMIPGLAYTTWRSVSGAPWPARDEFETGCTMEHAGYQIAPLVRLFGPVRRMTAASATVLPEKGADVGAERLSPDVSVGMLSFDDGVVARLSNSIIAPLDRSLTVVGEEGVLMLHDVWDYDAAPRIAATGKGFRHRLARKVESLVFGRVAPGLMLTRRLPVARGTTRRLKGGHRMDFARGIAAMAPVFDRDAAGLALHVTAVTLAMEAGETKVFAGEGEAQYAVL